MLSVILARRAVFQGNETSHTDKLAAGLLILLTAFLLDRFVSRLLLKQFDEDLLKRARALITLTVNAGQVMSSHWTQDPEVGGGRIIG